MSTRYTPFNPIRMSDTIIPPEHIFVGNDVSAETYTSIIRSLLRDKGEGWIVRYIGTERYIGFQGLETRMYAYIAIELPRV